MAPLQLRDDTRRPALGRLLVLLALTFGVTGPAMAEDQNPIHADEPLWTSGDNLWPRHVFEKNEFGCAHRIKLGDWRYTPGKGDTAPYQMYRFTNYGVVHCWMNVAEAYETGPFATSRPGFLIDIGRAGDVELWTLQIGARPGSDYLLLARRPTPGMITRFDVLQRQCPAGHLRGGASIEILPTRYCTINTKAELMTLAQQMAKLPPLGVLVFDHEP